MAGDALRIEYVEARRVLLDALDVARCDSATARRGAASTAMGRHIDSRSLGAGPLTCSYPTLP